MKGPACLFDPRKMVPAPERLEPFPSRREALEETIHISVPAVAELLLVSLSSVVDTMMVGQLGSAAISAVGVSGQIRGLLLCINRALCVGVMAVTARRMGEGSRRGVNQSLKQALVLSLLINGSVFVGGFCLVRPLLGLYGAQGEVLRLGEEYLQVICAGSFFYTLCLTINAAMRGVGNTRLTFRTNLVANIVNLVLNYVLINGKFGFPRLEVRGAAIATAIGNLAAFLMAMESVWSRNKELSLRYPCPWRLDRRTAGGILRVSSSSMVEQITLQAGKAIHTRIIVSSGVVDYAANTIVLTLFDFSFSISDGFGNGAASLTGQNLGRRRVDLAKVAVQTGLGLASLTVGAYLLVLLGFRRGLLGLYVSDQAVVDLAAKLVLIMAVAALAQSRQAVLAGVLRGAGDSGFVAKQAFVGIAVVRPALTFLLARVLGLGAMGAWLSVTTDQFLRMGLLTWRFRSGKWTDIPL